MQMMVTLLSLSPALIIRMYYQHNVTIIGDYPTKSVHILIHKLIYDKANVLSDYVVLCTINYRVYNCCIVSRDNNKRR